MPADFTLKTTLPPSSGKGAAISISVMPGYQSGQRLASLKSAMVSCGEALIWTLRCTIAIVDLPLSVAARRAVTTRSADSGGSRAAGYWATMAEESTSPDLVELTREVYEA